MVTEERTIEVTVISAMNLKKVKMFGRKQKCYAVASIYPTQKLATAVDRTGGVNPIWNSLLKLTCAETHLHPPASSYFVINVDIYSHGSYFGPKLVGSATLPLGDIFSYAAVDSNETTGAQKQQPFMVTYEVRRPSGKVKGTVNLSIRLGAKYAAMHSQSATQQSSQGFNNKLKSAQDFAEGEVVTGYPAIGPGQTYQPGSATPFAPLGPLPSRAQTTAPAIIPVRPSSMPSSSRRPTYKRFSCNRGRADKRNKTSVALLLIAGTILAIIFL